MTRRRLRRLLHRAGSGSTALLGAFAAVVAGAAWSGPGAVAPPGPPVGSGLSTRVVARRSPYQTTRSLAPGKFLVASPRLRDPNFAETVVLLVTYGPRGALGLVINRPSRVRLRTLLPDIRALQDVSDTVYVGGPVGRNQLRLLIRAERPPEGSLRLFGSVYVSASAETLRRLYESRRESGRGRTRVRAYVGYAGWAPGQLEAEVARGDWYIYPADPASIFDVPSGEVWPRLIARTVGDWARMPDLGLRRPAA